MIKNTVFTVPDLSREGEPGMRPDGVAAIFQRQPDLWGMVIILAASSLHLITGNFSLAPIFSPEAIAQGEWWRLLFHPFAHLSWYHLALDAGAFFLLYTGLEERRIMARCLYVVVCGAFSLLFAIWFSPMIDTLGLCGLSGIAHGLMAISALEMMQDRQLRRAGIASLVIVVCKSLYELVTGEIVLEFLQLGMCGTPMAACHFGGVVGGVLTFPFVRMMNRVRDIEQAAMIESIISVHSETLQGHE